MELLVKPEMLTSYIYGPAFGNAETACVNTLPASWQSVYTEWQSVTQETSLH